VLRKTLNLGSRPILAVGCVLEPPRKTYVPLIPRIVGYVHKCFIRKGVLILVTSSYWARAHFDVKGLIKR
jgi:hypothetical protein